MSRYAVWLMKTNNVNHCRTRFTDQQVLNGTLMRIRVSLKWWPLLPLFHDWCNLSPGLIQFLTQPDDAVRGCLKSLYCLFDWKVAEPGTGIGAVRVVPDHWSSSEFGLQNLSKLFMVLNFWVHIWQFACVFNILLQSLTDVYDKKELLWANLFRVVSFK